jgi:hypothetical protein
VVAATINGSGDYLGILVGYNEYGTISDCSTSGVVNGGTDSRYLGGLVGDNRGAIINCYATGAVTGTSSYSGGLCGKISSGYIRDCYATGAVTGTSTLGGLVGQTDSFVTHNNCYATGAVTGTNELGGLVGFHAAGMFRNCYATGAVTGTNELGGLVGLNLSQLSNCYATGAVTGTSYFGGLMGLYVHGTISNCYWDKDTTGQPTSSGPGTGKTTAEMKQQATFAGWDFTYTWLIIETQSYPYQHITAGPTGPIPGDVNGDGVVDFKDVAILCGNWLAGTEP